jgi:hypothetical protein
MLLLEELSWGPLDSTNLPSEFDKSAELYVWLAEFACALNG